VTTPEDVATETGVTRREYFSGAECEFSFCIPIVLKERTMCVILIGPCQRSIPSAADFAKAVSVMTTQSLRSVRALAQQTRLAITDGLTGLLNKKYVQEWLQERVMSAEAAPLGVFLFDIDHFKHYNDRNGHLAGDDLLRSMSEALREVTREGEVLGRYGGEEFLLLMPNADKEAAMRGAERIRAAIAKRAFHFSDGQPLGHISISGGVAAFPEDGRSAGQLIAAADQALYEAKRRGRDCVLRFEGAGQVMQEDGKIEAADDDKPDTPITLLDEVVFGDEE
jgi:diguanylate cyclase (GGDEF)-like protein